jgi:hypothetical protein
MPNKQQKEIHLNQKLRPDVIDIRRKEEIDPDENPTLEEVTTIMIGLKNR